MDSSRQFAALPFSFLVAAACFGLMGCTRNAGTMNIEDRLQTKMSPGRDLANVQQTPVSQVPASNSAISGQSPATPGSLIVKAQIQQQVTAPLNASATYALTQDDLQLLQGQSVLSAADLQALQPLVKP